MDPLLEHGGSVSLPISKRLLMGSGKAGCQNSRPPSWRGEEVVKTSSESQTIMEATSLTTQLLME
jgi:hypothetical protein